MPRIRKKTSKRGTTNKREKIKHKVSESHKKAKKVARKDKASGKTHKKSTKDPGIPNNFPYKDQILAEVAEQRRQAAEEKQRRKDEKRAAAARAAGANPDDEESSQENESDVDTGADEGLTNDGKGFDGIMSLRSAATTAAKTAPAPKSAPQPAIPVTPGPSTLRGVLAAADILLHVVDARDPAAGVSEALLKEAKGKKVVIVVNKADTVPRESLTQWLTHLRSGYTTLPFRAASAFLPIVPNLAPSTKKAPAPKADDALGSDALWSHLRALAGKKAGKELVVAVTGVTNSGKSALINSLAKSAIMPIYNPLSSASAKGPYTTITAQEVVIEAPGSTDIKVKFVDTPGLGYVRQEDGEDREETRARDILLRSRGRIDRLKDPLFAVTHIVARADIQDLMLAYSLPAFTKGDPNAFLAGMARVNGLVKKRGVLDHAGAARIVLKDWSTGRLARYTIPPSSTESSSSPALTELYGQDDAVVSTMKTRKEMRKGGEGKLVRLLPGEAEKRDVMLDEEWGDDAEESESEGEDGDEEEDAGDEEVAEDDDSEKASEVSGEEDADEDEEEAPQLLPPPKRKRTVSFAALPAAGKRRRGGGPGPKKGLKGRK
ncbi:hypothetical protein BV22DRAFT_1109507 [Leucogyrophana mollusca]|uniref:Uncharacterized protein n=1 Tax=Leucogyrophana mollusca TaxID=85980 RepID=A0ACB8BVS1_9AGAM|nr:hypothetical protein BV22DRAFT_1109507 [Leucogyrophana mollusca]